MALAKYSLIAAYGVLHDYYKTDLTNIELLISLSYLGIIPNSETAKITYFIIFLIIH